MIRIVKFLDGTYGVKRGYWIFSRFLSNYSRTEWHTDWFLATDGTYGMFKFDSLDAAKNALKSCYEFKKIQKEMRSHSIVEYYKD